MRRRLAATLLLLSAGCPRTDTPPPPPADADEAALPEARLPPGWAGQGVLARQSGPMPRGAPPWTRNAAEVIRRDDERVLRACGRAGRIKSSALARSTAESRARAELSRWLRSRDVEGSRAVDTWTDADSGVTFALLEVVVPDEWIPGRPLPE